MTQQLPFELMLAICRQFQPCPCPQTPLGCTGNHAPAAFASPSLSALRQTSRAWRFAALHQGLSELVTSNRWMRRPHTDRLATIGTHYSQFTRRLIFRSSDFYQSGPRRSTDGDLASELETILAMPWQNLESVIIEWFSGTADDHRRIAQIVRRYAPNVSEVYVRDKALTVSEMMPLVWGAGQQVGGRCARIQRLAICPYGYDQQWAHLLPNESGAASMIANRPSQFTSLAVGGADFTPELVTALQTQRRLRKLTIEHAWIESLSIAAAQGVCLPSITSLHLEHIIVSRHDTALPVSPRMFPNLQRLSVRHVWQHVDARTPGGSRGAISLQNEHWLQTVWNGYWPELQELSLPAISDLDATKLPESCPNLTRLTTNSLDYAGPRLSAHGLVSVLRGLHHLHFLSIEQRSSQGAPGYEIHDSALCRLIGSTDVLSSRRWSAATVRAGLIGPIPSPALSAVSTGSDTDVELDDFEMLPPQSNCLSASLNTLILPRASFTASTLDTLVRQLPGLVRLSASLRSEAFFGFAKPKQSLASAQNNVKWIGLSADEDVLTDAMELSAWIEQRFPSLQECSTNYARSHRTVINSLKTALPNVAFTRLNSSALQAICS